MSVRDPVMASRSLLIQEEFGLQRIERTAFHHVRAVGSLGGSLCDEAGQLICVASRRVDVPLAADTPAGVAEALNGVEHDLLGDRRHDPAGLRFRVRDLTAQAGERSRERDRHAAIPIRSPLTTPTWNFGSAPPAGARE
jgi:hypothetical protein